MTSTSEKAFFGRKKVSHSLFFLCVRGEEKFFIFPPLLAESEKLTNCGHILVTTLGLTAWKGKRFDDVYGNSACFLSAYLIGV